MDQSQLPELVNLVKEFIPVGRRNRPGTRIGVSSVTIHNTSNATRGADAVAHSKFVREKGYYEDKNGKKHWVSWHFTVDDKTSIQQLPVNELSYHAGTGANGSSVAIEICMQDGIDEATANIRAAILVAGLLHDLSLDTAAVRTHWSWTGKDCPVRLLEGGSQGAKWRRFVEMIDEIQQNFPADGSPVLLDQQEVTAARGPTEPFADDTDMDHRAIEIPPEMLSDPATR